MKILLKVEKVDGQLLATSDDFPDFLCQAPTEDKIVEWSPDIIRKLIEHYVEYDLPLPIDIILPKEIMFYGDLAKDITHASTKETTNEKLE